MRRSLPVVQACAAEAWADLYEEADEAFTRGARELDDRGEGSVSCTKGCSHCCYKATSLELAEVPSLLVALAELSDAERARVRRRTRDWEGAVRARGVDLRDENDLDRARLACPLLEANLCMIYARRPLACRLHAVVGSDPVRCRNPSETLPFLDGRALYAHTYRVFLAMFSEPRPFASGFLPQWLRVAFWLLGHGTDGRITPARLAAKLLAADLAAARPLFRRETLPSQL